MWTSEEVDKSRELHVAINMTDAVKIIKNFTAEANATNIVAIVVEGMTSRDLVINAKEYPYLRKAIKKA